MSLHDLSVDPDGADDLARIVVDWGDGTARQVISPGGDARHRYHRRDLRRHGDGHRSRDVRRLGDPAHRHRRRHPGRAPRPSIAVANPFVTALRPGQRLTAVATNDGASPGEREP
ncbi:MAG: hypothetical protein U1F43_04380 [Myxococcota bacterium]